MSKPNPQAAAAEISIISDDLVAAIGRVQRVVETRSTIPILANLKLTADKDGITITATDLDIQATTWGLATVAGTLETTVPGKLLFDIARKMPKSAPIRMRQERYDLHLTAGKSRFKIATLPSDDYPKPMVGEWAASFQLRARELARAINRCKFAISTEETRYYLNGLFFEVDDGQLVVVATDGHRLSRTMMECPDGAEEMPASIIPRKTVEEILHLIDKAPADAMVDLDFSKNLVRLEYGKTSIVSKLIDGTFPDYRRVIPAVSNFLTGISNDALNDAIERVSTIASERGRAVKLELAECATEIVISCVSPEHGTAVETADVDYVGPGVVVGFKNAYVRDILRVLEGDKVEISITDPGAPVIFREPGQHANVIVLMPMRV